MRRTALSLGSALAITLLAAAPTTGQSVAEIVEGMYEVVERSARTVNDYTLVSRMMGFESSTYFEKTEVGGRTVFMPVQSQAMGMTAAVGDFGVGGMTEYADALLEHGRYGGSEQVDGRRAHILILDDVQALDIEPPSGPDDVDFVAKSGRLFVDADRHVPLRIEFDGEATTDTGVQDVTTVVELLDYRDVQGLMIPYRTSITIEGINAMVDPETQAELDEMMKRLEEMDPQQRAMMERMLGPQIEQMKQMMAGGGDAMTMEVEVTEVRVNAGPPGR